MNNESPMQRLHHASGQHSSDHSQVPTLQWQPKKSLRGYFLLCLLLLCCQSEVFAEAIRIPVPENKIAVTKEELQSLQESPSPQEKRAFIEQKAKVRALEFCEQSTCDENACNKLVRFKLTSSGDRYFFKEIFCSSTAKTIAPQKSLEASVAMRSSRNPCADGSTPPLDPASIEELNKVSRFFETRERSPQGILKSTTQNQKELTSPEKKKVSFSEKVKVQLLETEIQNGERLGTSFVGSPTMTKHNPATTIRESSELPYYGQSLKKQVAKKDLPAATAELFKRKKQEEARLGRSLSKKEEYSLRKEVASGFRRRDKNDPSTTHNTLLSQNLAKIAKLSEAPNFNNDPHIKHDKALLQFLKRKRSILVKQGKALEEKRYSDNLSPTEEKKFKKIKSDLDTINQLDFEKSRQVLSQEELKELQALGLELKWKSKPLK